MKHVAALILSISFAIANAWTVQAQDTTSVVKVISGTVFTVASGDTISLLGVGIPPSGRFTLIEARDHMNLLLVAGKVYLDTDPFIADPPYGPKPRYVYLLDQSLVNLRMIAEGYATAMGNPQHSRLKEFRDAEKAAANKAPSPGNKQLDLPGTIKDLKDIVKEDTKAKKPRKQQSSSKERSESVQCSARTKKGTRCSRTTTNTSGKCWQHE